MLVRSLFLLALVGLAGSPSFATDWRFVGVDKEEKRGVYVDRESMLSDGRFVKIWVVKTKSASFIADNQPLDGDSMMSISFACSIRRVSIIQSTEYRRGRWSVTMNQPFEIEVIPGSIGESVVIYVCGSK